MLFVAGSVDDVSCYEKGTRAIFDGAVNAERYLLTFENRALREIASQAPYEALVILANNDTYGGGGIFGLYSTLAVDSSWADYLFVHEFGHHFAALADEYYTSPVAYAAPTTIVEPWEPNVTAALDRDKLKWRHLVATSTPVPTPWPRRGSAPRRYGAAGSARASTSARR